MKRIKSFKIFESNIETIKMECEDILVELRDLGLSIEVTSAHIGHWRISIIIKDGASKFDDLYKTNVQTPIFEHLFSYLEEEGFKKIYDSIDTIVDDSLSIFNPNFDVIHQIKFVAR